MAIPIRKSETDNIIKLSIIDGKATVKPTIRINKDGTVDKRHNNKVAGVSSEVYPFNTQEEIMAMLDVFDSRINNASNDNQRKIANRNKLMFLIGINVGLRASDLATLKWNFFFNNGGGFKEFYTLQPKKTRKQKKFVKLYFNNAVKKAVMDYTEKYPINDVDEYLFKSRKGDGAITERAMWKIIVDTASDAGIQKNVGSHSLRKTFGFWAWHNAEDKNKALVTLQMLFNHSDGLTTMKYIGLLNSEIEDMFNSVDLGY